MGAGAVNSGQNPSFEHAFLQGMGNFAATVGQALDEQANAVSATRNADGISQHRAEFYTNQLFGGASRIATSVGQVVNQQSHVFVSSSASNAGNPLDLMGHMASVIEHIVQSPDVQDAMEEMANVFGQAAGVWQPARPPTSDNTIDALPKVKLSAHDLEKNHSTDCVVCLEKFSVGEMVVRIPCDHVFHEECIKVWLKSSNTCPVCRFELPTDDAAYEEGRRARMEGRKPRLRLSDLLARSPHELRYLAEHLGVNIAGCIEKNDVVHCIASSGCIEVIPEPSTETSCSEGGRDTQVSTITLAEAESMSIRDIKAHMVRLGISSAGCLEKLDLIQRLVEAGFILNAA